MKYICVTKYVYLIRMGEFHKIGFSRDPADRLRPLGLLPEEPVLVHQIESYRARLIEKTLHERFKDACVRGEWFRLSEEDVASICSVTACHSPKHLPAELLPPGYPRSQEKERVVPTPKEAPELLKQLRKAWTERVAGQPAPAGADETLCAMLCRLRELRGWTQRDLSESAGVPQSTLAGLESGRRGYPRPIVLVKLAAALEVPLGELAAAAAVGATQE